MVDGKRTHRVGASAVGPDQGPEGEWSWAKVDSGGIHVDRHESRAISYVP